MELTKALPTGTLTFLFTDIEGSTRLLQRIGDRFSDVLDEHHRIMRETIQTQSGVEVSTEGDSFFAVFTSAPDAIAAAVEMQRAVAARDWGADTEVRVRIGLHTGEGKLVGASYGGVDVHRAARIASAAHGGQVLLSATTAALVERSMPEGVTTKDLGDYQLRDLEGPERLHQLCIDGLPSDFPPPRTLGVRPTNLPLLPTSFVARNHELEEIRQLLWGSRLVTLSGPGGTGKTRLALAVGERVLTGFSDGVFVVFLAAIEDPRLLSSAIAQALKVREQASEPIEDTLVNYLKDKELLLVLDNFEQIVEAARVIQELLGAAPRIKVLVTSRTLLRVAGEREYKVPPMALPDPGLVGSPSELSHYESVDLFVQRARDVTPSFSLTEDNSLAVAEICRRLDGLPLAIELAAARTRVLTPPEIVTRLNTRLSFLTGGARDLPPRQRTLRNAIGWSYDLLDDLHQAFFRRLGVFAGAFDFEAAGQVTDARDLSLEVLDAIEVMVDNSLVRRAARDSGATRFWMLQTIREFAMEQLIDAREEEETRARHAAWYLNEVESASQAFTAGPEALDAIELEHDNIRSALRWTIDRGDTRTAMRVGSSMWRFWQMRGHLAEGNRWLTEIVAIGSSEPTVELGRAVMALGSITYWQNDFTETRRHYLEALNIFRAIGDEEGLQQALYNAGFLSLLERDPASASDVFKESREIGARRGDDKALADTAWGLAMAAIQAKDWDDALGWGEECGRLYDALGDLFGRGLAQFVTYQVARYTGDVAEARRVALMYMEESDAQDMSATSAVIEMLAETDLIAGNLERALRLHGAAQTLREDYGGGSPPPLVDMSDPREAARATLDEHRISELWEEGRRMAPTEALAYALKDLESEPARLES